MNPTAGPKKSIATRLFRSIVRALKPFTAEIPKERVLEFSTEAAFGRYKPFFPAAAIAHPAKANLAMIEWIIKRYTKEGDPIFGGFSRECLTTLVVRGRKAFEERGENLQFHWQDMAPEWARDIRYSMMCALSSAEGHHRFETATWYDHIRNKWNNPAHFCSPYNYFEGVLHPIGLDDNKDVIYEYRDWATQVYKEVKVPRIDSFA